jgi:hypothetical protein
MDPRVEKAQQLFWEISVLRQQGAQRATLQKLTRMSRLHEERALELLSSSNADGWTDLYAAITAWGEAGARSEADRLLHKGREMAAWFRPGQENIEKELDQLEAWLDSLRVVPSLWEFDQSLPPLAVVTA